MNNCDFLPVDPEINSNPTPKSLENLLKQILEVLQNSTIAEERGPDVLSRFWAAYKKVSGEYDSDMLERCNGNMDIVLIFAGLFSAVNTAFIIAMQPDPVDITNALLVQLIQTLDGSSAVQPTTLSTPTGYSSAYVWAQALAYASLAFSLLAAFGAVLGKQWLGYYKTNRYCRGSLEARCKQRHRKFRKLQIWQFENVLHSFPVLLEISLLLFSLSLGAAMWTQHQSISILIIATTGLGVLGHIFMIMISAMSLDSPFQTSVSLAIRAIIRYFSQGGGFQASISLAIRAIVRYFRESGGFQTSVPLAIKAIVRFFRKSGDSQSPDVDSTISAIQWILETSTNPDVVGSAVELMLNMSEESNMNIESVCAEIRDMFKACFDHRGHVMHRDGALAYGKALIHLSWNNHQARVMLSKIPQGWNIWTSWRALYLPCELDRCLMWYSQTNKADDVALREHAKADLRTALRMVVTIGIDGFTSPDDEHLIWNEQFRLHSFKSEKDISRFIDQLTNYVKYFHKAGDFEVAGDALLLASGIATIQDSDAVQLSDSPHALKVIHTITSLPLTTNDPRWSCIILAVVRRLINWHVYSSGHPDEIPSQAVLTALCSPVDRTQFADDQYGLWFNNATRLFNLNKWPEGHHLEHSPLPEIQRLILLALRCLSTPKVDNAEEYILYCSALSRLMGTDNPELRHFALHTAFNIRQELALIDVAGFDGSQQDTVLSKLSPSLLTIANNSSTPTGDLIEYLHLIATLARNPKWCRRLKEDGHDKRCTTLITADPHEEACFYLAQCFLWMAPPEQDILRDLITNDQRWFLAKMAWRFIGKPFSPIDDALEIIPILVESTEISMPQNSSKTDTELFRDCLEGVASRLKLKRSSPTVISAVTGLKGIVERRLEEVFRIKIACI